jgi:hypothetical protein
MIAVKNNLKTVRGYLIEKKRKYLLIENYIAYDITLRKIWTQDSDIKNIRNAKYFRK